MSRAIASLTPGINEKDLQMALGARHHAHVCSACNHKAMASTKITVTFEIFGPMDDRGFDDLPGPSDLLDALEGGLPREWFTNMSGADWWVQTMAVLVD